MPLSIKALLTGGGVWRSIHSGAGYPLGAVGFVQAAWVFAASAAIDFL